MTAVIGFLALLRDRLSQGKDAVEYVDRIEREAARIDRILRDLLALARPADRLRPVDVQRCATQAALLVRAQPTWPSGTDVQVAFPPGLPSVAAEKKKPAPSLQASGGESDDLAATERSMIERVLKEVRFNKSLAN